MTTTTETAPKPADDRPIRQPTTTCNARNRNGSYCGLDAGWGTDHVGEGRCKLHGGDGSGRPPIHGLRATRTSGRIRERAAALAQDDPMTGMLDALATCRAFFEAWLDRIEEKDPDEITNEDREHAVLMLATIGKLVDRIERIRNSTALTAQEIKLMQVRLSAIAPKYLPDSTQRIAFLKELSGVGIAAPVIEGEVVHVTTTTPEVHT